ncbi:thiol reductant ABC exporter subunit CydC [Actinomadura verrucosospora]|uniref:ABC transporter ATP-binding protein n=1 Tax=Actinomadura verrucosospora TaxID=46165 RepID=A0A7D4AH47_ACTVE|nr:thiol reductant ABC exporter subunit CydC [Actinomadura verrucosospora]QKG19048.1 ABC transporter ATP-binding protein [Actinomadura verrucosospora]
MWGAVRPHAARLVAAALAGVAAEVCGLGLVATAAWLIARASQRPELAVLSVAIVAVRGLALAKGSLRYVERLAGHDATLRALAELRGRVFDALAARRRADGGLRDGGALTRMVSDVEAVQDLLLRCVLPGIAAVVCGVVGVAVCALVAPAAAVVLAAGLVVAGPVLAWAAARASGRAAARVAAGREELAVRALDVLEGAADLAVFGADGRFAAAAGTAAAGLRRAERAAARVSALVAGAGVAVQGGTVAAVAWAALGAGAGQVGAAVAGLSALVAVESVLPLAAAAQRLREVRPAVRRVEEVLAAPAAPRPSRPVAVPRGPLPVELLGVHVSYPAAGGGAPGRGRAALDGVDLRVERGRRVAVVGASGAGKSTLLAAVAGEVAPSAGAVLLGGHDTSRYDAEDVRGAVRGLMQDAHVFAGSVRANLLLAHPDASDGELEAAARRARFLEVVRALPDGWDTPVGTGGHGLSGGQRQRLLLARALLADPPVLLLDEPAEALDPVMADAVVRDLLEAPGGGTLLLVTHRLAALDAADEVVVMDRGRVVQRGRHEELVAVPGPYRDLWDAELLAAA